MGADKADEQDRCIVVDLHNEPVGIPLDVEYHPVAGQHVSGRIAPLDVGGRFPLCSDSFMEPHFQGSFGIGVLFIKIA